MRVFSYFMFLLLVILGLSFAMLNAETVKLNYYFGTHSISLSLLLVLCVGIGVILGFLVALIPVFKLKKKNHGLKQQLKQIEKELANLRQQSVMKLNAH